MNSYIHNFISKWPKHGKNNAKSKKLEPNFWFEKYFSTYPILLHFFGVSCKLKPTVNLHKIMYLLHFTSEK